MNENPESKEVGKLLSAVDLKKRKRKKQIVEGQSVTDDALKIKKKKKIKEGGILKEKGEKVFL